MRLLLPEDVWRRVGEARREEQVVVAQLRRVEAKDVVVEAFLRPPLLGSSNRGVDGERGSGGVMMGCLMAFAFSPWRVWRTSGSATA